MSQAEWSGTFGRLQAQVYPGPDALARAAAARVARVLRERVDRQGTARVVVATGNSQLGMLAALQQEPDVPWPAVTVFHMDEYVGLPASHPASFQRYIAERVAAPFEPAAVHYIAGDAPDPGAEARRYEYLLRAAPLDLVCMGIGENGHIAFNEPHRADFHDPAWVGIVRLDDRSRRQQVGEGHFATVEDVPREAISLTVPALLAPAAVVATVPERRKAAAVRAALTEQISTACPATILRQHPDAVLFLDPDSASELDRDRAGHA